MGREFGVEVPPTDAVGVIKVEGSGSGVLSPRFRVHGSGCFVVSSGLKEFEVSD